MPYIWSMPRKPNPKPPLRKTLALPEELWDRVSAFRFDNRIQSEVEAVRRLIESGLAQEEAVHGKRH